MLAIAGDTAVVDVRVTYETRQYGTTGEITAVTVWHNLVGLRLADGKQAWQRPDLHYGDLPTSRWRAGLSVLYAAPGTVVLAEQHESGQGPARQQAIALRAFTAATGEPAWSVDLPGGEFVATALNSDLAARTDSVVLLPDGRLVLMYLDFAAPNGPDRCVVAAWNTATGARQADVRLFRTARDAVSTRCSSSIPVEVGNAVALQVPQQGLVMLR